MRDEGPFLPPASATGQLDGPKLIQVPCAGAEAETAVARPFQAHPHPQHVRHVVVDEARPASTSSCPQFGLNLTSDFLKIFLHLIGAV